MRIPYKKIIGQDIKPGRPSIGKKPEKPELKKFYIKEARSIREIAEILGVNEGTVKSRINRGRAKLQELLKDIYKD